MHLKIDTQKSPKHTITKKECLPCCNLAVSHVSIILYQWREKFQKNNWVVSYMKIIDK